MRHLIGFLVFLSGAVGLLVASKGVRGWDNWSRRQRIGAAVSGVLILVGLIVKD
ncbi:hypothetical protein AB0D08_40550 [Kitasatospora sp. NPDC048540]|uniref:hypothetical protein n=1 Tax=Kitasatospora sp. NPDC048540 TaxID=3155634 RepID=UPI0033EEA5F8